MKTKQLLFLFVCTFAFANSYAANRYWVGGTAANWTATTSWSETSGGTSGATVPGASDDVIFETGAATTVTLGDAVTVNSITFTSRNVTFAAAFTITTTNMTVNSSQVKFVDYVTVNSALTFSGTDPRITQLSPTWGKHFKMGNGGAFTLTGNSPTNYFEGKGSGVTTGFVFDTTSALTVYFSPTTVFGGIIVTKGLITVGSNFNAGRITLSATNNQELIVGENTTFTMAPGGSHTYTNAANGGVINASATGSKVLITSTNPTLLGVQSPGAAIVGRIFKDGSTINHLEYNSSSVVFYLPFAMTVKNLTLTAGTINNSTNSITIEAGGSVVTVAGSTTAPVLLSSAIHSVSKTSEPVFHYNNGIVTLKYTSDSMDKVHFKLMNLNGQVIFSKSIQSTTGTNTVSMSIGELPSGIYLTSVSDGVNSLTGKIIQK